MHHSNPHRGVLRTGGVNSRRRGISVFNILKDSADFARLPVLELEGLFGAVVPPPPCALMTTHKGKQLGFFLTLDIDEDVADILIETCTAWEQGGRDAMNSVLSRHAGRCLDQVRGGGGDRVSTLGFRPLGLRFGV